MDRKKNKCYIGISSAGSCKKKKKRSQRNERAGPSSWVSPPSVSTPKPTQRSLRLQRATCVAQKPPDRCSGSRKSHHKPPSPGQRQRRVTLLPRNNKVFSNTHTPSLWRHTKAEPFRLAGLGLLSSSLHQKPKVHSRAKDRNDRDSVGMASWRPRWCKQPSCRLVSGRICVGFLTCRQNRRAARTATACRAGSHPGHVLS